MIKRILIGIGGTPFTAVAIRRAVELGSSHGAQVTAVTVVDEARLYQVGPIPLGGAAAAGSLREHRVRVTRELIESAVASLEEQCAAGGVPLKVFREHGDPFGLLSQHARYNDVMIFGLRSMFEYDLLGAKDVDTASVLNGLARAGVSPIAAVSEHYRTIHRVLLAYDGSMQAASAMKQFVRLRLWPDVSVRILACNRPQQEAQQLLAAARDYCLSHGIDADCVQRQGKPGEQILQEVASWDADLVVLGCSGRGPIRTRLLGATALHVLRHVDRPMFVSQ